METQPPTGTVTAPDEKIELEVAPRTSEIQQADQPTQPAVGRPGFPAAYRTALGRVFLNDFTIAAVQNAEDEMIQLRQWYFTACSTLGSRVLSVLLCQTLRIGTLTLLEVSQPK